ncbi:MAG: hypothetical protein JNL50_14900 [Phycisphaerae bacterium]|nr:hypothetical protein [Phycisphaerae bacterium]
MNEPVSNEDLVALALGELDPARRSDVEARIAASPDAARTLASITMALRTMKADDSVAPPPEVLRRALSLVRNPAPAQPSLMDVAGDLAGRAREFLCTLVRDTLAEPALAGFRGTTESRHLSFECDVAEIDLQVSPTQDDARRTIRGQVAPLNNDAVARVSWRSTLTGAPEQEIRADESGVFVLECPVGVYELSARVGDSVVRVPPINVA